MNHGIEKTKCLTTPNLPNGGHDGHKRDVLRVSILIETHTSAFATTSMTITNALGETNYGYKSGLDANQRNGFVCDVDKKVNVICGRP